MTVKPPQDLDLLAPEFLRDPYPTLRRLRETDPVHWSARHHAWLVTRHSDATEILRDRRFASHSGGRFRDVEDATARRVLENMLVFNDPPKHTRLRKLVGRAFTPRVVSKLESRIELIVGALFDEWEDAEWVDFVERFAFPLPAWVIAELIGVPAADRKKFHAWANAITDVVFRSRDRERMRAGLRSFRDLDGYFETLIARYRTRPRENLLCDLLAIEESGDRLQPHELRGLCAELLTAGHETTMALLASSVWLLDRFPEVREALRSEPDRIAIAVEEMLRFESPVRVLVRTASEPASLSAREIRSGERLMLLIPALNRDPEHFEAPEDFVFDRAPNPHLAFGMGPHFCIGASLARLEARLALRELLARFPAFRIASEPPQWRAVLGSRSLARLALAPG
ncbi:MAG: cytochrome P450 [Myxococcales bacterium]|nr:cytochrome P450 [Myxococcales bacterium]